MSRTCLVVRHLAFEDLGLIEAVLLARGFAIRVVEAGIDDIAALDPLADDVVIVLGGPVGVYEDDVYPFLRDEIAFLRARIEGGRALLGICLGAQLIAAAAGAAVYPGREKEIGWAPVTLTTAGHASPLAVLDGVDVLHWHGDTFDLPDGAVRLASTGITLNQAFAIGNNILGIQFHIEVLPEQIERWLIGHRAELGATRGLSIPALRAETRRVGPAAVAAGAAVIAAALDRAGLK
ncbi:glutamine amidotransferase [Zavarzinia compransoris]|uniref:Glutamine amidotransferase n=1 Tax=Zavarzinia compransoris TaxID=1264899 RepID=A0A317DVY6_9PROT|nr:glutamine amidotransferase [Zavarzinia compransoris]PWR18036.1 glutamine amidotransferase [Zavarzinia compransoris]TDP43497.1 GMP synthase (glutamine-hydrolysing) [Zavarzinia compransoris]